MRDDAGGDETRRLASRIMRRQAGLSLRIAAVFVLALVALPLLNLLAPGVMGARVGGFTLGWLILAVLFYPFTIVLSALFVRGSDRIEASIASSESGDREPRSESAAGGTA